MPTYKNVSDKPIIITLGMVEQQLQPGEIIKTTFILDSFKELKRIADEPYYNPVQEVHLLNFSSAGDTKIIPIVNGTTNTQIRISNLSVDVDLYFNSEDNDPPLPLSAGDVIILTGANLYDKLIFKPKGAGNCKVVIFKNTI